MIADLPGAVILSPLTTAAGPVSAFNALQALHVILAAAAGAALCRSAGLAGASVGGLSLALSPVLLSSLHNGNPDVTPVFWIPLAALAAHRIREGWGWSLLAGLAVGASAWFSPYVGTMSALAALAMAPWRSPRALLAGAVAASVAGRVIVLRRRLRRRWGEMRGCSFASVGSWRVTFPMGYMSLVAKSHHRP